MRVLFFGRLAEAIAPELDIEAAPGCSVAELRARLAAEHPAAADVLRSRRARICVSDRLVDEDYRVRAGDTVEFLAPVSGG